ncbi:protein-L-isoaspartate O-methyltransferase family protein [Microvirga antarctica]|uniref:protein-L-isoaspartate O-methyltransferase family protein n=1 Tax=Microvirga antarctica TaxID=2819233 RepID=UPI001B314A47|nr:protein-L-isoaspartate O-methyltransferase [Microvirga antarctica]
MVDFSQARRTMVDSQLRTFDVNDIPLLDAIDAVPRESFVMPGRESLAYSDQELPVSDGPDRRFMLTPAVLARLIQALEINSGDAVLDVACGRGYASAIMGLLGATVTGLESDEALADSARRSLADAGNATVTIKVGNLAHGHKQPEGFDAILINGALDVKPETLLNQLKDGGRLACVMGRGRSARATLFVRAGDAFGERALFDAAAPVLAAFQAKPGFKF